MVDLVYYVEDAQSVCGGMMLSLLAMDRAHASEKQGVLEEIERLRVAATERNDSCDVEVFLGCSFWLQSRYNSITGVPRTAYGSGKDYSLGMVLDELPDGSRLPKLIDQARLYFHLKLNHR